MKKILCLLLVAIAIFQSRLAYGSCNAGTWSSALDKNIKGPYDWVFPEGETRELPFKSLNETFKLKCLNGQVVLQCGSLKDALPECGGDANKEITLGNGNSVKSKIVEGAKKLKESRQSESNTQKPESATTSTESTQTTPPDAGKILDTKTESGKKTDLSSQSVTGSTKQPTIDGTAAMQHEKGKTTSGNVEKSSFVGASNLSDDYGMGDCGSGNIFQQLACRAGVIGSGLKTVGYMIAGFGLIVFSFAAIFGKVKWPLFATIMFSCFLLSATVFVVNMMTDKGDAGWIGGIKGNGSDYYSDNATNVPATDSGGVPDGESPK